MSVCSCSEQVSKRARSCTWDFHLLGLSFCSLSLIRMRQCSLLPAEPSDVRA